MCLNQEKIKSHYFSWFKFMSKQVSSFEASCIELQNDPVNGQVLLNFKNAQSLQLTWKYSSMTSKLSAQYFCCFFSFSTAVQRSDKTLIKLEVEINATIFKLSYFDKFRQVKSIISSEQLPLILTITNIYSS